MPVLGVAGPGYGWLKGSLDQNAHDATVIKLENSGHFVQEEQPQALVRLLNEFFERSSKSTRAAASDGKSAGAHQPELQHSFPCAAEPACAVPPSSP